MTLLTRLQAAPFLSELRETVDAALHQLDRLQSEAADWLERDKALSEGLKTNRAGAGASSWQEHLVASGVHQTHIFDALDAFLGAWARVSLLFFPLTTGPHGEFRKARGDSLVKAINPKFPEQLNDRDLRDAWMHFDERLDYAVRTGAFSNRQRFTRREDIDLARDRTLRLFAVDSLEVWYFTRAGKRGGVQLLALREALEDLLPRFDNCLSRL